VVDVVLEVEATVVVVAPPPLPAVVLGATPAEV